MILKFQGLVALVLLAILGLFVAVQIVIYLVDQFIYELGDVPLLLWDR